MCALSVSPRNADDHVAVALAGGGRSGEAGEGKARLNALFVFTVNTDLRVGDRKAAMRK